MRFIVCMGNRSLTSACLALQERKPARGANYWTWTAGLAQALACAPSYHTSVRYPLHAGHGKRGIKGLRRVGLFIRRGARGVAC
jgi:hypothetical protein